MADDASLEKIPMLNGQGDSVIEDDETNGPASSPTQVEVEVEPVSPPEAELKSPRTEAELKSPRTEAEVEVDFKPPPVSDDVDRPETPEQVTDLDAPTPTSDKTPIIGQTDDMEKVELNDGTLEKPVYGATTAPLIAEDKPVKPPRLRSMKRGEPPLPPSQKRPMSTEDDPETGITIVEPTDHDGDGEPSFNRTASNRHSQKDTLIRPAKQTSVVSSLKLRKGKCGLDTILSNKWILLAIILFIFLILVLIIVAVAVTRPKDEDVVIIIPDPPVASIKCGDVEGLWEHDNKVAVFKGVPYLKPPLGDMRWKKDELSIIQPSDCLGFSEKTSYKATDYKDICFQMTPNKSNPYTGSEDCLFLHIWSPAAAFNSSSNKNKLPVMVYLHGGFLHFGSGIQEQFSPTARLALDMNAVIVSLNYRLNIFGWLSGVKDESGEALKGNYGLWDQVQALEWVQKEIAKFGGDKSKVTVFGISSGGTSVYGLMEANKRKTMDGKGSLFTQAWVSGASVKFEENNEIYDNNDKVFRRNSGCADYSCFLNKTSEELIESVPWEQYPSWSALEIIRIPKKNEFIGAVMVIDGEVIKTQPLTDSYLSLFNGIPLIIGNMEFESDMYQVTEVSKWTVAQYKDYLRSRMDTINGTISDILLNEYPELMENPRAHMSAVISDLRVTCPNTFLSFDLLGKRGTPTANSTDHIYRYVMTAAHPSYLNKYRSQSEMATHAGDFLTLFHYPADGQTADEEFSKIQTRFRNNIKEFVHTGKVSSWSSISDNTSNVTEISVEGDKPTSRWTTSYCDKYKMFHPAYSWQN